MTRRNGCSTPLIGGYKRGSGEPFGRHAEGVRTMQRLRAVLIAAVIALLPVAGLAAAPHAQSRIGPPFPAPKLNERPGGIRPAPGGKDFGERPDQALDVGVLRQVRQGCRQRRPL